MGNLIIETEVYRIDHHHFGAGHDGFSQTVIENWLILARKATDYQDRVKPLNVGEGHPQSGIRRCCFLVTEIRLPQSMIDIAGSQLAH